MGPPVAPTKALSGMPKLTGPTEGRSLIRERLLYHVEHETVARSNGLGRRPRRGACSARPASSSRSEMMDAFLAEHWAGAELERVDLQCSPYTMTPDGP